jgi:hypothetical protein
MKLADLPRRVVKPLGEWPKEVHSNTPYATELEWREARRDSQRGYYDRNREKRIQAAKEWRLRKKQEAA